MLQDVSHALKVLLKQKAFTAAALLTLALCIGANTAIFTVLETVVLRPLPFPHDDEVVTMYNLYPGMGVANHGANGGPDYLDRRKMKNVFSEVALIGGAGYELGDRGAPVHVSGQFVTPSFFTVLQARPKLGRTFTEEEGVVGKEKVAVLSEGLWKEQFGGDPRAVGRDIRLNGSPYRVVGVMPSTFEVGDDETRLWIPFAITKQQTADDRRHSNNWGMIARLAPGVSLARAQERIDDLNRRNLDLFPKYKQILVNARFNTKVRTLKDELVREIRPTLYLLQIAVGAVLLIGCVNLANLMLVRSNVRIKEMAIRYSLGSGRWRIARQLLTESVMLSAAGAALGLGVAYGGVRLLAYLGARDLPRGAAIGIDGTALAFTAGLALLAGIAFGSVPLFHVLRSDLNAVFRGQERTGTAGRGALFIRSALVVSQFAFAFVLLIGSGLLTMSFVRLLRVNPGFQPEGVQTAGITLPRARYSEDSRARNYYTGLLSRLAALPGVRQAAITNFLPFSGNNNSSVMAVVGYTLAPGESPPVPGWNNASPEYFRAMGIPILQGRSFSDSDGPDAPKVAIVDEFLARKYWPNGNAVGGQITRGIEDPAGRKPDLCTVIGVVGKVKTGDLAESNPVGQIYFNYNQYTSRNVHIVIRTAGEKAQLIPAVQREVQRGDPELPLSNIRSMPERLARSLGARRAAMMLCLIFAGLAVLLAAIGIYGVLAYSVSQRTREFGIRAALGAGAKEVVGMVVGYGLRMAAIGLALGAAGAFALTRLMTAMLYDVRPSDPSVFAGVIVLLTAVACVASFVPSARAARIPPATALRHE
jgi:predicted permease